MQGNKKSKIFSFDRPLVIVGAGEVDTALLFRYRRERAAIIAADGGANICAQKTTIPDAIIGDMDSIRDKQSWQGKTELVEVEEQETNDFEKCLKLSEAPVTIGLGLCGGRVDHTLANLDILLRYGGKRRLAIATKEELIIRCQGRFEFDALPGSRISIIPVEPIKFANSEGLEYPLDGLELGMGKRVGVSNSSPGGKFVIEPEKSESALYLLVMERPNLEIWTRDSNLFNQEI